MELALGDELAFEDTFFKFYADEVLVAGPVEASDELARKSASRYAFMRIIQTTIALHGLSIGVQKTGWLSMRLQMHLQNRLTVC